MPRKKIRPAPPPPKRKMPAGLAKPVRPSPDLAAIIGAKPLTRAEIVKRAWVYIREHGLQDPADRRTIVADDKLRSIIGERCGLFELPGKLSAHLTAA